MENTQKIPHFYHRIQGWFDFEDLYREAVAGAPAGARFVEIGSWRGKSTAFLAVEIANSGKNIELACVDTWNGDGDGVCSSDPSVLRGTLYDEFLANMKPVEGRFVPLRMASAQAAELFEDGSLDFVFIDAEHTYDACRADIAAWRPKVKAGGTLAGHDFTVHWPGVVRAVREAFPHAQAHGSCWKVTL